MNSQGEVLNPGNLSIQTRNVMLNIDRVLNDLDCDFNDLVTLLCFYVNNEAIDEREFLQQVANCLPSDCQITVNAVPVPYLAYSGLMVEIEGYAMRRKTVSALRELVSRILVEIFCQPLLFRGCVRTN